MRTIPAAMPPWKQRTGAQIVASAADAHLTGPGGADNFSPFPKDLMTTTRP